jgi:hypothetical protein
MDAYSLARNGLLNLRSGLETLNMKNPDVENWARSFSRALVRTILCLLCTSI